MFSGATAHGEPPSPHPSPVPDGLRFPLLPGFGSKPNLVECDKVPTVNRLDNSVKDLDWIIINPKPASDPGEEVWSRTLVCSRFNMGCDWEEIAVGSCYFLNVYSDLDGFRWMTFMHCLSACRT